MARLIATGVLLLFAVGGFFGLADGHAGPFSPFGFLFLAIAFVFWRHWDVIAAAYAPFPLNGLWERLVRPSVDPGDEPPRRGG